MSNKELKTAQTEYDAALADVHLIRERLAKAEKILSEKSQRLHALKRATEQAKQLKAREKRLTHLTEAQINVLRWLIKANDAGPARLWVFGFKGHAEMTFPPTKLSPYGSREPINPKTVVTLKEGGYIEHAAKNLQPRDQGEWVITDKGRAMVADREYVWNKARVTELKDTIKNLRVEIEQTGHESNDKKAVIAGRMDRLQAELARVIEAIAAYEEAHRVR